MPRDKWFVALAAISAVILSLTLNHDWPQEPPAKLKALAYPEEIPAGGEIEITAKIEENRDPSDCIVGASLMVQMSGRLSFTRWTATRTTNEDAVSYVIQVPKQTKPGPARVFIRESYFCENRNRVAFVNGGDVPAIVIEPEGDDLPVTKS